MRLIIFDMDGTLIDSVALIVETVTAAFEAVGEPAPGEAAIRSISGITASGFSRLSLRGKMPVRMNLAFGAFARALSISARMPRVMFATFWSPPGVAPTLFVPPSMTMTFGFTPSSSPCWMRQSMFSMRSAPHPKSAAFHPRKFSFQFARSSG